MDQAPPAADPGQMPPPGGVSPPRLHRLQREPRVMTDTELSKANYKSVLRQQHLPSNSPPAAFRVSRETSASEDHMGERLWAEAKPHSVGSHAAAADFWGTHSWAKQH